MKNPPQIRICQSKVRKFKLVFYLILFFRNSEAAMLRSIQDGFQDVHFKFTVRLLMAEDIQNALPAAITVLRICDLSGQNFRTGAFFIAKLVYMAGHDHFPKVSVSIHSLAVYSVQISAAGPIEFHLCRENTVFHAGHRLFIVFIIHLIALLHNVLFYNLHSI